jgi:hypothetical protein
MIRFIDQPHFDFGLASAALPAADLDQQSPSAGIFTLRACAAIGD